VSAARANAAGTPIAIPVGASDPSGLAGGQPSASAPGRRAIGDKRDSCEAGTSSAVCLPDRTAAAPRAVYTDEEWDEDHVRLPCWLFAVSFNCTSSSVGRRTFEVIELHQSQDLRPHVSREHRRPPSPAYLTGKRDREVLVGVLSHFAGEIGDSQTQAGQAYVDVVLLLVAPSLQRS
jgi:hypothetical protein